jgi:DNA polymerase III gamma/tau subunit
MNDRRYQEIMENLGMPNSNSLLAALKQVANEVAQETFAAVVNNRNMDNVNSMTNDELRQAIEDTNAMCRTTSPNSLVYKDIMNHLRDLLMEQKRRATQAPIVKKEESFLWIDPEQRRTFDAYNSKK